ncbi:MAG TPA: polysaccharide pyruvyl transferase family protein [Candidimonas sp.]|nr:polysaccharide pyruvyl transferase family protein [Candidimonas sp.]
MKKVYLYGYFGFGNLGDDLLLHAVISHIRTNFPYSEFIVRSLFTSKQYKDDNNIVFLQSESILIDASLPKWKRLLKYALLQWRAIGSTSHFIFAGGTLFHARDGSPTNLALISLLVLMARVRGVKVYALGVGVAPIRTRLSKILMLFILRASSDFVVRDSGSFANCRYVLKQNNVRTSVDLVLSLPVRKSDTVKEVYRAAGLTIAASDIGPILERFPLFIQELRYAVTTMQAEGWTISLLSFQESAGVNHHVSDAELWSKIFSDMPDINHVHVSSDTAELVQQLSAFNVIGGMRFHSLVLAGMLGKPFLGFGRDSKLQDFCNALSMPFIKLDDCMSKSIYKGLTELESRKVDEYALNQMRAEAKMNFTEIDRSLS